MTGYIAVDKYLDDNSVCIYEITNNFDLIKEFIKQYNNPKNVLVITGPMNEDLTKADDNQIKVIYRDGEWMEE